MSNNKDYQLSAKQAAKELGKSVTTVHRYVRKGKLSGEYVETDHGKEVRLKESEVEKLADKLNMEPEKIPPKDVLPVNRDEGSLDTIKLLDRYERRLYQLGQLTEKLENEKKRRQEKIKRLEQKVTRLKTQLQDKSALIGALQNELARPLTIKERLKGERIKHNSST